MSPVIFPFVPSTEFTRGKAEFNRGKTEFTRGKTEYTRGQTEFSQGQTEHSRGLTEFSRGQTELSRGQMGKQTGDNVLILVNNSKRVAVKEHFRFFPFFFIALMESACPETNFV